MKSNKQSNESNKPLQGFLKLMRSPETEELLHDPLAFALLANIALRTRWRTKFNMRGLNFGEALIGDYKKIGFSRKQYRTRLQRLVECGLITTRPTPRGTIATLAGIDVFDINIALPPAGGANCFAKKGEKNAQKGPTVLPMKNGSEGPTEGPTEGPLTNNDKKERRKEYQGTALGNSTPSASSDGKRQSGFLGEDYQNQPAQSHIKWPEFAEYCRNKGGQPREDGFWKWLCGQKPQWRNKRRPDFDEHGYLLDGKFLPAHEANALAAKNSKLLSRFQRAVRRDGKVQLATNGQ